MNTDDKQISEALISLGWTPPASDWYFEYYKMYLEHYKNEVDRKAEKLKNQCKDIEKQHEKLEKEMKFFSEKVNQCETNIDNKEEPEWIVSNNGEIGLKLGDRCIFMDNGKCVEYSDGRYENGDAVFYRPMKKTEFISINDTAPDSHSWSKFNYLTSLLKRGEL